jgi:hypothetical protein
LRKQVDFLTTRTLSFGSMATPVAANTNYRKSLVEEAVQEVVYVQDCRSKGGRQIRINRLDVTTYEKLVSHIRNVRNNYSMFSLKCSRHGHRNKN